MTTEAQRLADALRHDPLTYAYEAAALLRHQEAALRQAREALEPDVHRAEWVVEQDIQKALAAINELLGEKA